MLKSLKATKFFRKKLERPAISKSDVLKKTTFDFDDKVLVFFLEQLDLWNCRTMNFFLPKTLILLISPSNYLYHVAKSR